MFINTHTSTLNQQSQQNGSQRRRQGVILDEDASVSRVTTTASLSSSNSLEQRWSVTTSQTILHHSNQGSVFTPLFSAVYANNVELVKTLLEEGCNCERDCDLPEATPLHLAAHFGYTAIMDLLIEHGTDLNGRGERDHTPLHLAVKNNQLEAIKTLLSYDGIDVNATDCFGRTPLFYAAQNKNIDAIYLLGFHLDADLAHRDIWVGNVLVNIANTKKSKTNKETQTIVNALLAAGIDVDSTDQDGNSALFYAVKHENTALIAYLLENGASYTLSNTQGITPYTFAKKHKLTQSLAALDKFISSNPSQDKSSLPKIDTRAKSGEFAPSRQTPAVSAVKQAPLTETQEQLLDAVEQGDFDALNKLTKGGSQGVNTQDETGNTLLHVAIKSNAQGSHDRIIAWLLKKANVNAENHRGDTPLIVAIERGDVKTIDALSKKYVDWKKTNRSGDTALHKAVKSGNDSIMKSVLGKSIEVNAANAEGSTAMHLAVAKENESIVKLLLGHKDIDLRLKDNALNTALHLALSNGGIDIAQALLANSKNLEPNARNKSGNTIVHLAVMAENRDMLESILEYDLDLNLQNQDGLTAIDVAESDDRQDIAERLSQYAKDQAAKKNMNPVQAGGVKASQTGNPKNADVLNQMKGAIGARSKASFNNLKKLLNSNKANVEVKNEALLFAIKNGNLEAIRLLVKSGANVNYQGKDKNQDTALHLAAKNKQNETWDWLIENGANTQIKNAQGLTAEDIKNQNEKKPSSSSQNSRFQGVNSKNQTTLKAEKIKNSHDTQNLDAIKMPYNNIDALLIFAIDANDIESARWLLKGGANPNQLMDKHFHLLHWCASNRSQEWIKLLLEFKVNINQLDKRGYTAMYYALALGKEEDNKTNYDTAQALLDCGINLYHASEVEIKQIAMVAEYNNEPQLIEFMKKAYLL